MFAVHCPSNQGNPGLTLPPSTATLPQVRGYGLGLGRVRCSPAGVKRLFSWFGLLVFCPALFSAAAPRFPQLERFRLPGGDEDLWRGKLTVFENRTTRTGRTLELNVIVVPSLDPKDVREPFFELAGGPGLAITDSAAAYANDLKDYRRHRDIVLVDQRGTGGSNPLAAPHDPHPAAYLREMYPVDYVEDLRRRLEAKADLTQYTTAIAMDDLDDVRAWLGYDRINLLGFSYGSRAALVYLRQHPTRVRSMILMGVNPPAQHLPMYHARDGQRALDLILDECLRDPIAGKAFPQIKEELAKVLAVLAREPAQVRYVSPDGKTTGKVTITREVFAEKLRTKLYEADTARRIPLLIHAAAAGDFAPFLASVIPKDLSQPDPIADGMYLSVLTAEDVPFIDQAAAEKLSAQTVFGNYRVSQQTRASNLWPRAIIPAGFTQPIQSKVPVLIISGLLDPVTPPEWAESVARHLPNSRHVILKYGAHLPYALSNVDKLDALFVAFLDAPNPLALDISGLEQMLPPPFAVE